MQSNGIGVSDDSEQYVPDRCAPRSRFGAADLLNCFVHKLSQFGLIQPLAQILGKLARPQRGGVLTQACTRAAQRTFRIQSVVYRTHQREYEDGVAVLSEF